MIITIIAFILVLSVLVLVHEAGHYFVAKWMGVKVEEFGFGFPPRAIGKKIGETIYSINWLPIGGFVKLYGEDDAGGGKVSLKDKGSMINDQGSRIKDEERAFYARNPWQRAGIVVAGVVMNFLLAVVIFSYVYSIQGVPIPQHVTIAGIAKNSPAAASGLVKGDIILSVDGHSVQSSGDIIMYTLNHLGQKLTVTVKQPGNKIKDLTITPRKTYPKDQGPMGIELSQSVIVKKYPWYQAPYIGLTDALNKSWLILQGLGDAVVQVFTTRTVPAGVAGPVGIAQLTGQTVKYGFDAVLSLVALLSLNLAIMNILPIPALDGGRLFFILFEGVTGKKVSPKIEAYIHTAGMALLLLFILLITFHDLFNVFTGHSLLPQ